MLLWMLEQVEVAKEEKEEEEEEANSYLAWKEEVVDIALLELVVAVDSSSSVVVGDEVLVADPE